MTKFVGLRVKKKKVRKSVSQKENLDSKIIENV